MGIRNMIVKAGGKAANKVAELSALSSEQLQDIENKRNDYLSEMPAPDDLVSLEQTLRLLAAAGIEIHNAYLPQIKDLYLPMQSSFEYGREFDSNYNIRYINITKWVTNKKENNLEKLVNVYATLSNENCNIALIFHRTMDKTDVYMAVTDTDNGKNNVDADQYMYRLTDALHGNFPGAEWSKEFGRGRIPYLEEKLDYHVAVASNIPTEKSEKFVSQTIEKLLDGIAVDEEKEEYTLILLATPVRDVEERKLRLAQLYSGLAPYAGWQTNFTYTESNSANSSATFGLNAGVSAGVQHGQNESISKSQGITENSGKTVTDSENKTITDTKGETKTQTDSDALTNAKGESQTLGDSHTQTQNNTHTTTETKDFHAGVNANVGISQTTGVGVDVGVPGLVSANANTSTAVSNSVGVNANSGIAHGVSDAVSEGLSNTVTHNITQSITDSLTHTASQAVSNAVSQAIAKGTGKAVANTLGRAVSNTVAKTAGAYKGINFGGNFGANFARSSNVTATVGKNEGITQSFTNFTIKHSLELLEEQMKRYEESVALGMWDFAAYVISEDLSTVNNVAHSYIALTQGEKSFLSQASINIWRGDKGYKENLAASEIVEYLRDFRHPVFGLDPSITKNDETYLVYPVEITAATSLSGKELAYSLNFPQKSIVGLPVLECAEFGRNIVSYEQTAEEDVTLPLGNVFHMNHEEKVPVSLSANSLTGHTFITGSTGSGKSNTVYQLISEARKKGIKFLVVEPAKGEYKTVFGIKEDVSVYGTNPSITPLLKISPFSFPEEIHILEHLDRLVEIFNVCWPMYAAMPAVLKNAVERSYVDCGWDLITSENEFSRDLYPTFADVARNVKTIIDSSEYDAENKGAYKGSLLTRLQSLSNGINGLIFTTDEIESEKLFDENVIVDISRVGSTETKSLLMGMLILKLQEYRMAKASSFNNDLKHLTVLEEAHNLLKRTSTEQVAESANLTGKSVEMLTNAIAEMRTYGEGFIIADQAPGLLDMSVIRNTNTKIIMRLPDETDRVTVGKAANLNDDQITELAKLPRGVGAVYQNEWVQPVLCKVSYYKTGKSIYKYEKTDDSNDDTNYADRLAVADLLSKGNKLSKEIILKEIKPRLEAMKISDSSKVYIFKLLLDPPKEPRMKKLAPVMSEMFPDVLQAVVKSYEETQNVQEWTHAAENALYVENVMIHDQTARDIIQSAITCYISLQLGREDLLTEWRYHGGLQ